MSLSMFGGPGRTSCGGVCFLVPRGWNSRMLIWLACVKECVFYNVAAFCDEGIGRLVPHYEKCLLRSGDYLEM